MPINMDTVKPTRPSAFAAFRVFSAELAYAMELTGPSTSSPSRWNASVPSMVGPLPAFASSTFWTVPTLVPMYSQPS